MGSGTRLLRDQGIGGFLDDLVRTAFRESAAGAGSHRCGSTTLLSCFDRIIETGVPELVLASGYSGIGKSSVVDKVLVQPRGLFASGKFDQYKRDVPYATLVQAFQSLVRPLLGKSEDSGVGLRLEVG
jgi:predicted ATPase